MLERHTVTVTTAGGGAATAYTDRPVQGRLFRVVYTKDDFAAGVDFTITLEDSGQNVWTEADVNASKSINPLQPMQDNAGADVTWDGTRKMHGPIIACRPERVKIVIAQGGDTKSGTFVFYTGG